MSRDRGRLLGLLARWRTQPQDAQAQARFEVAVGASRATRAARAAALPRPGLAADLPIAREAERIIQAIRSHPVVVIAGETGSGKTTQLPQLCLLAGRGAAGMIGCTQPRRIAARAVARRVAEELQVPVGGTVGFQVRFNEQVADNTAIKFMTDGILLAEIQSDRWLSAYDTLIIDEAHERSLNIDFLLGYLQQLLQRRDDLKVIVTSATIDTARFAEHFGGAPVIEVEGRSHPVEVRWRPPEPDDSGDAPSTLEAVVRACDEIARDDPHGDVLIFLPGEREIRETHLALERRKYRHTEVLPLYARLSTSDQDRVFHPGSKRRIVLATNVAETSLTVPRIRYVVDPGLARVKRYSPRQKLDRLHIEPVSQASADQRKGRCGRLGPGICYRLYAEADYLSRPRYTDPEIRRAALAGVILRMLALGLGGTQTASREPRRQRGKPPRAGVSARIVEDFPFLDPPDARSIADGWQQLLELRAVDSLDHDRPRALTDIGRDMARLPVDVKLARMLIASHAHGCLREMLAIASYLGIQDPRERPADARQAADLAHAQFADPKSEFAAILKLWDGYRDAHEDLTQSKLRSWCESRFLNFMRMREWRELHRQLKLLADELRWAQNDLAADYGALHRALIAGLPTNLGQRIQGERRYDGPRGRKFQLFPGSALVSRPPPWVLSATLLDTEKLWALTNAAIEPDWAIAELPHLLTRRHHDPRWSRSQGRVVGSEQVSLFGLVLAPKRPIHYGALYPQEAREMFVRDALVTGEINARSAFLSRNLKTLETAREEEAKQRRTGLVVDEDWMARWYLDRLPEHVHNAHALDAWYGKLDVDKKHALEWTREDLLLADEADAERFPAYLPLGDTRLAVRYRFEPDAIDDGMTVAVPLHLLTALDAAQLSWLAPGFIADRAAALIRGLPKSLRRNYVPAPDFARAFAEGHRQPDADSLEGALARFLSKATGAPVVVTDFELDTLPAHLRANLQLFDEAGAVLAESRDLEVLRKDFGARATAEFARRAGRALARDALTAFPAQPIPLQVAGDAGVPAYPALVDAGDSVALEVFADAAQARAAHPAGVRRLLALALAERMRQARRQLPVSAKTALLHAALQSGDARAYAGDDSLQAQVVDGAFADLSAKDLDDIRDAATFAARRDALAAGLFPESVRRLQRAEAILDGVAQARIALESSLIGWAQGNLDDMRAQLAALVAPGFLRGTPAEVLAEYPRYLKAIALRAERALRDPARDQARMLEVKPFADAVHDARAKNLDTPEWNALRWDLEELRVSLFAQELGVKGAVSPKKLAARLAVVQATR